MSNVKQIFNEEDFNILMEISTDHPILLLKHSNTCPISRRAFSEFVEFPTELPKYYLVIQENRELSNDIEITLGVEHKSPQLFLLDNKKVTFETSHSNINKEVLLNSIK